MKKIIILLSFTAMACSSSNKTSQPTKVTSATDLVTETKQYTFSGKRAGEGYFSPDGKLMIFQSEREENNPFYQMYVMNTTTNKIHRVSPGYGKTTCGWIHPSKTKVIYSSTHQDPQARQKQQAEIDFRNSGKQRRYSWDYDENYEIYSASIKGRGLKNLTRAKGYDAEASISPDGRWIVFASNRHAYSSNLSAEEQEKLAKDPSYFLDIYLMDMNGRRLKRLTTTPGYDGGPFFSPDSQRVVWRRFAENGKTAEVMTINMDGTNEKQITQLNAMSWAPYYHPSGDYIIFTSNLYGYSNFELFIVDTAGTKTPIRVTNMPGFDGLPVFTPDGKTLTWNRKLPSGESQIFTANWNDTKAREALGLPKRFPHVKELSHNITKEDSRKFIEYLASEQMRGRSTGSAEEGMYASKIARYFKELGLKPINGKDFSEKFSFAEDVQMGSQNTLVLIDSEGQHQLKINKNWRPAKFSKVGEVSSGQIAFAGYGIVAPETATQKNYDSYAGLNVKDKWVMVLRYVPEDLSKERRQHLLRYSRLEHKLTVAKHNGAKGIIFVSGPTSNAKKDLIPFGKGASAASSLPAISITDDLAEDIFKTAHKDLKDVQKELDKKENVGGFFIPNARFAARIDLRHTKGRAQNVVGMLKVPGARNSLVIGAHGDHLGAGHSPSSLKNTSDKSDIHYGADDNASGVAGVMELAHWFQHQKKTGKLRLKQNIIFAVWSGEELGNLGSSNFLKTNRRLRRNISAYLNMDMIGRLKKEDGPGTLAIQGVGSSKEWKKIIEAMPKNIAISLSDDPYLPTDAISFYTRKIPILSFFTGVHSDYHTPRDTVDKIDYTGLANTVEMVGYIAQDISSKFKKVSYNKVDSPSNMNRRGFRIFLGTIPDYSTDSKLGVAISGVVKDGPAEKAGLKAGDIIVQFSETKIQNIHDYVYSLESARPGQKTSITVLRNGKRVSLNITPQARE